MRYGGACDMVAGEFWATGGLGNIECRSAASTAHAYGKKVVYAEALTSGQNWELTPYKMKARGDWAFTEGINHFVLHVNIQQPDDQMPGINAWFGTEFNRHNTWYYEGKDWIDYCRENIDALVELSYALHRIAIEEQGFSMKHPPLSPRELEVLWWTTKGKSAAEIASILELRPHTVAAYMRSARYKLNAATIAQAVSKAISSGLISE